MCADGEIIYRILVINITGGKAQGGMDGGIRVPTLIRWPQHILPGHEIDIPLSNIDFLPTAAELAGMKLPTDRVIDGVSMLPLLTGQDTKAKRDYLIHYCSDQIHAVRFKPDQGILRQLYFMSSFLEVVT